MPILIQKRNPFIRSILLMGIVSLVTIAFWMNSARQLSLVMNNQYIPHADIFFTKEEERNYTQALRKFSSEFGIEARLVVDEEYEQYVKEKNILYFVIQPISHTGYISYPTLLAQTLTKKDKESLNARFSQIAQSDTWEHSLLGYIHDVYTLLSSFYIL